MEIVFERIFLSANESTQFHKTQVSSLGDDFALSLASTTTGLRSINPVLASSIQQILEWEGLP